MRHTYDIGRRVRMKILLVEDSATLRAIMLSYITKSGHETIIACSGEESLQVLETNEVDMIIMDVEMPGLDGYEATRLIRESRGSQWIPIIFVSGMSDDESLAEGIEAGGDDYLIKPVSQVILNAKIRAMERLSAMRDEMNTLNAELIELSQRDPMTGLYNRRAFDEKAEDYWRIATRNKEPLTLLILDIDHFKLYNDAYGHIDGDECIRKIATALNECFNRPGDVVARYGGEEFIVLLSNTTHEGAQYVAEQMRTSIAEQQIRHKSSTSGRYVSVSIGGSATSFTTGTTLGTQIELADKALYESKNNGRDRVTITDFSCKQSVLVIAREDSQANIINDSLNGHCKVISNSNADRSAEYARCFSPKVIILDFDDNWGYAKTICTDIRANPMSKGVPIIIISSKDKDDLEELAEKLDANSYLRKPFKTHRLLATVNKYL